MGTAPVDAAGQLALVELNAAQVDRGALDRAMAEQDLYRLERIDVRREQRLAL